MPRLSWCSKRRSFALTVVLTPLLTLCQYHEEKSEQTWKRITLEFARLGFDQANINTIAELAGIGKGTIYLYFENKRELFMTRNFYPLFFLY
jgi:hypothetical protein